MTRRILTAIILLICLQGFGQSAGPDQTICRNGLVTMAATSAGVWSALATNPASTTFVNASDSNSAVFGFSASGTFGFVWTSGGGHDTMTVTVTNADISSIVASPDSIILAGQSATLTAQTVVAGGSYQWTPPAFITAVPGSPQTIIATPNTTMSFCLSYTVSGCQTTKCQTIHVQSVYAGPDQNVCQYSEVTMAALGTGVWSALNTNPTPITFTNPSDSNALVSGFTTAGAYSFIWTSGGNADTAIVHVNAKPNAGPDRSVPNIISTATMLATGTGSWMASPNNPGVATIASPTSPTTIIESFGATGTYDFYWFNGLCADTAEVTVLSGGNNQSPVAQADSATACMGQPVTVNVRANDSDPDSDPLTTPVIVIAPISGTASLDGSGNVIYTPNTGYQGNDSFYYQICDITIVAPQPLCDTAVVYIKIPSGINIIGIVTNTCAGASSGSICLNVAGGAPSYTYVWGNGVSGGINCINNLAAGVYPVSVSDNNGCTAIQSDTVGVSPPIIVTDSVHNVSCPGGNDGSINLNVTGGTPSQPGIYTYVWSTLSTAQNVFDLSAGQYGVTVVDNLGCDVSFFDSVSTEHDCVWPGDVDANGIADNNDLLPIGVAYGLNGFVRTDQSIIWSAHYAHDWGIQFLNAANVKHADCNGDGIINADDTTAIIQNFGLTHAKTNGGGPWRSSIPELKVLFSADSLYAGDTLTVTFVLGTPALPADSIYGLAFTYNFDPLVVDSSFTRMTIGDSWLGTSTDKISINKILNTSGQIPAALTRIDHTTRSGNGVIGSATFRITTDNISGKDLVYYANTGYISDITAIDQHGNPIPLNAGADTSQIGYTPTGIREITNERVTLYPNPTHDRVTISAENTINDVSITNVAGQEMYHQGALHSRSANIEVATLEEGLYFVQIRTNTGTGTVKMSVVR